MCVIMDSPTPVVAMLKGIPMSMSDSRFMQVIVWKRTHTHTHIHTHIHVQHTHTHTYKLTHIHVQTNTLIHPLQKYTPHKNTPLTKIHPSQKYIPHTHTHIPTCSTRPYTCKNT